MYFPTRWNGIYKKNLNFKLMKHKFYAHEIQAKF